jgi:hypothetical protein
VRLARVREPPLFGALRDPPDGVPIGIGAIRPIGAAGRDGRRWENGGGAKSEGVDANLCHLGVQCVPLLGRAALLDESAYAAGDIALFVGERSFTH